ncbi:hypothetical protein [uncultured Anaerococcus sp.]|uniref:hypothetical protein n=1 Tax=uncultured Anaerococcus sp. TaxID=293428 RepID=UPI0025E832C9|nr:hypothetical protein [uncultured Anaerococcus sp.]
MDLKKASQLNLILGFIGLAILIFDFINKGRISWHSIIIFLIIFTVSIIIEKIFFKCPHCDHHIKREDYFRKTCKNCGKPLDQ